MKPTHLTYRPIEGTSEEKLEALHEGYSQLAALADHLRTVGEEMFSGDEAAEVSWITAGTDHHVTKMLEVIERNF